MIDKLKNFKYTHYVNNARATEQIILISNNVTQGLKSMFFNLKDRQLCNSLHEEVALCGINTDELSIMRNNRADAKKYLKRRENQSRPDMKVPTLTGTNFE